MLTINLLQALPKTPLWDRLEAAGRLDEDGDRESNVVFARPYDEVLRNWRRSIMSGRPVNLGRDVSSNLP
jgi:hopanoid C-2 methylase